PCSTSCDSFGLLGCAGASAALLSGQKVTSARTPSNKENFMLGMQLSDVKVPVWFVPGVLTVAGFSCIYVCSADPLWLSEPAPLQLSYSLYRPRRHAEVYVFLYGEY